MSDYTLKINLFLDGSHHQIRESFLDVERVESPLNIQKESLHIIDRKLLTA